MASTARVRAGMVGGGPGAFIGQVHRMAAALDGRIELVCGSFSADADKSLSQGLQLGLDPTRVYPSYASLFAGEAQLPAAQRMQFVIVVTPNDLHFPVSRLALEHGFHVLCDKPATLDLDEALQLRDSVNRSGLLFGLTYTYAGYPLVQEARRLIASGSIGRVRNVQVEYLQGWLADAAEAQGNKQAQWRVNPSRSGAGGAIGDLGVHALHLAEYVSNLQVTEVCADLATFGPGRMLDDDGRVLLRLDNGARGQIVYSQICAGEANSLRIRVYGEKGGIEWDHDAPSQLTLRWSHMPTQVLNAGHNAPGMTDASFDSVRLPIGHPEGYIEAFGNLYRRFAAAVAAADTGERIDPATRGIASIEDGVRGMAFIEHAIRSSRANGQWQALPARFDRNK